MGTVVAELAKLCRICAQEFGDGYEIFEESEEKASLVILINKYLPITIVNDEKYPSQICETCHSGVAASVDLIDRMVEGQLILRQKNSGERLKNNEAVALIDLQGKSASIPMDDIAKGKESVKLYGSDHPLSQCVAGTVHKRKRGRPKHSVNKPKINKSDVENIEDVRPRRQIAVPLRYRDNIQEEGAKLENENVILDDSKPRIFVSGGHADNSVDVPFALNIEILEQNGNFILSEVEKLDDINKFRSDYDSSSNESILESSISYNKGKSITNSQDMSKESVPSTIKDFISDQVCTIDVNLKETNEINSTETSWNRSLDESTKYVIDSNVNELPSNLSNISSALNPSSSSPNKQLEDRHHFKQRKHQKTKYSSKCPICGKNFVKEARYFLHLKLHGKVMMHCVSCKMIFNDHINLRKHQTLTSHTGIAVEELEQTVETNKIQCTICTTVKIFSSKERYDRHIASVHSVGRTYSCDHCRKEFVYLHSLRAHINYCPVLTDNDNTALRTKHKCDTCNKVFKHLSSLNYHIDSKHNNGRMFICSICGSSFRHRQLLLRHKSVHSVERPYECGTCLKKFKTRCNLMNHASIHSEKKKYSCEFCSKQFSHITAITSHLKIHRGEKNFHCTYCDKKFVQNGNLLEHMRIHTGEKPFECNVCGKNFRTSSQMKTHLKIHKKKIEEGRKNIPTETLPQDDYTNFIDSSSQMHLKSTEPDNSTKWIVAGSENENNLVYFHSIFTDDKNDATHYNVLPSSSVELINSSQLVTGQIAPGCWSNDSGDQNTQVYVTEERTNLALPSLSIPQHVLTVPNVSVVDGISHVTVDASKDENGNPVSILLRSDNSLITDG